MEQIFRPIIDPDILVEIDDFRFKNRIESRAEAIRWLLHFALDQKPKVAAKP